MGFSIKEAIEYYLKHNQTGDMAVHVDESDDVIAIGTRDGVVVPIVRPGAAVTAEELMQKAGIESSGRARRKGVHILSDFPIALLPSRWKKAPDKLQ
ncbi:MAG: hypothetical protein ACOY3M_04010 [Patescibacteria group bacterium]